MLDLHHAQRCLLQAVQLAGHELPAARTSNILSIHSFSPTDWLEAMYARRDDSVLAPIGSRSAAQGPRGWV